MQNLTLVTGLFDLGRGSAQGLGPGFVRPFEQYLDHFARLLQVDAPMSVYIEPRHEPFVWQHRSRHNTRVFHRRIESFRTEFQFYDQVQRIRQDPSWRSRAAWLAESPQANLELYNPLVMSKMGMLHDQSIINPFGTDHLLWIDAGIAATCGGYLQDPRWLARLQPLLDKFLFLCFPYEGGSEVHGFARELMASFAQTDHVRWVARGGLFGGARHAIAEANRRYYRLLELTLAQGEMGTEESVFSIMVSRDPECYNRFLLPDDGLILHFLDALIHGPVRIVTSEPIELSREPRIETRPRPRAFDPAQVDVGRIATALYVVSFNRPAQFRLLLDSWSTQPQFLTQTTRYLIDNSTDSNTTGEYTALCAAYGFEHIKHDNLGICGARQFAAEHFDAGPHDYMFYLEDDMLAQAPGAALCQNGFPAWVDGLYEKLLLIMEKEGFDFLKLSFTEAFGHNAQQWAWYNVPARVRREVWPELPILPREGFADVVPSTRFEHIGSVNGLAYASGEVYYANWPQIVGRSGNRNMFIESRLAHPYEQTWMSHMFQMSRRGQLRGAVLLASPIRHCRVHHYDGQERKES
ncbi:MAG: WlaTC/HtrL family glycosyltransferase [Vicinamibacterales bacterium]